MTFLLVIISSALVGFIVAVVCAAEAHNREKKAFEDGKFVGYENVFIEGKEKGRKQGEQLGYIKGLKRGRLD